MSITQDDPIKHVVVLMLENRSFDQMLGDFQQVYPNLDGINQAGPRRTNTDDQGQQYEQVPTTVRCASNDPDHKLDSVLRQIGAAVAVRGSDCRRSIFIRLPKAIWGAVCSWCLWLWNKLCGRAPRMVAITEARCVYEGHFVAEYVRTFPNSTRAQRDEVMGYYPLGTLPALHFLARHFTVCDRWFSSLPGPTWANRFFVHTGTCRGIARSGSDAHYGARNSLSGTGKADRCFWTNEARSQGKNPVADLACRTKQAY